eukprot:g11960.t1
MGSMETSLTLVPASLALPWVLEQAAGRGPSKFVKTHFVVFTEVAGRGDTYFPNTIISGNIPDLKVTECPWDHPEAQSKREVITVGLHAESHYSQIARLENKQEKDFFDGVCQMQLAALKQKEEDAAKESSADIFGTGVDIDAEMMDVEMEDPGHQASAVEPNNLGSAVPVSASSKHASSSSKHNSKKSNSKLPAPPRSKSSVANSYDVEEGADFILSDVGVSIDLGASNSLSINLGAASPVSASSKLPRSKSSVANMIHDGEGIGDLLAGARKSRPASKNSSSPAVVPNKNSESDGAHGKISNKMSQAVEQGNSNAKAAAPRGASSSSGAPGRSMGMKAAPKKKPKMKAAASRKGAKMKAAALKKKPKVKKTAVPMKKESKMKAAAPKPKAKASMKKRKMTQARAPPAPTKKPGTKAAKPASGDGMKKMKDSK